LGASKRSEQHSQSAAQKPDQFSGSQGHDDAISRAKQNSKDHPLFGTTLAVPRFVDSLIEIHWLKWRSKGYTLFKICLFFA
jgi:hypothetical protein